MKKQKPKYAVIVNALRETNEVLTDHIKTSATAVKLTMAEYCPCLNTTIKRNNELLKNL